jgi:hypothetical protein
MEMIIDWDHVYLLGWRTSDGRSHLSTWIGDLPWVNVIVFDTDCPPMWNAPVKNATVELMPSQYKTLEEQVKHATERGGLCAFGWYVEKGIDRINPLPWRNR